MTPVHHRARRRDVLSIRTLIPRRPFLLAGLLACTLLLKLLVPFGYMPVASGGGIAIVLCPGVVEAVEQPAMAGMHHGNAESDGAGGAGHAKADMPCAFAGLGAPAIAAADTVLLAAAIAFVTLRAIRARIAAPPLIRTRLRPPLRAPPVFA